MKNILRIITAFIAWAILAGIQGEYWNLWSWVGAPFDETPYIVLAWLVSAVLAIGAIGFVVQTWDENDTDYANAFRMIAAFFVWAIISGVQGEFWGIFTWLGQSGQIAIGWVVSIILGMGAIVVIVENWEK